MDDEKSALDCVKEFCDRHGFLLKLTIRHHCRNKIHLNEECLAINNQMMVLEITLRDEFQFPWLLEQLKDKNVNSWVDDRTFSDRNAILERYGF